MATKRLTFDVDEKLHARLKAEAAALGLHLGAHCAAILGNGGGSPSPEPVKELDPTTISTLSLGELRALCSELADEKPKDWKRGVMIVNTEIRRRYRT